MKAYVFIDVSRKQEYIYRNKSLRDNLINSYRIKAITEIPDNAGIESRDSGLRVMLRTFLDQHFSGEYHVIYSGGGNCILEFEHENQAKEFSRQYSLEVLRYYPDIELYISKITEAELQDTSITEKSQDNMKVIRRMLAHRADLLKDKRRAMFRRWSYGIEKIGEDGKPLMQFGQQRVGESTAIPASDDQELYKARHFLFNRLERYLNTHHDSKSVEITTTLASYKSSNDRKSYIGIIAIDGNRMGELFNSLETFEQMKNFSDEIEEIYANAVANALSKYAASRNKKLQVTPVLMSGDDICLITHAEDALDITADILKELRDASLSEHLLDALKPDLQSDERPYLTACAGVAIVKVAYPFFDAIKIAEKLCHQAKEALHRSTEYIGASASFIDWDIVQGQVSAQDAYENRVARARVHGHYRIRPLRVDQDGDITNGVYSYEAFRNLVDELHIKTEKQDSNGKAISHSFLEKIKKQVYGGWESYSLLFEMDQTDSGEELSRMVENHFVPGSLSMDIDPERGWIRPKYGVIIETNAREGRDEYRYVLNDVLETMAFLPAKEATVRGN